MLKKFIGGSGVRIILLHLEMGDYFEYPTKFHKELFAIFGNGALVLEKQIVNELFLKLDLPHPTINDFSFERYVALAKNLFLKKQNER